jgi:hypothetical protein
MLDFDRYFSNQSIFKFCKKTRILCTYLHCKAVVDIDEFKSNYSSLTEHAQKQFFDKN